MQEFTNHEYDRLRRIAHLCRCQLPEPFAIDTLLMLYDVCDAHELCADEMIEIFGVPVLHMIIASKSSASRENPVVYSKMDLTWDRPFVVTQIGSIGGDRVMRPATDEDGGNAFRMQEIFRKRRRGG